MKNFAYLKLSYNGKKGRDRTYFDVVAGSDYTQNQIVQASYDVKYSEVDTERNGEIQFKYRTGPGSSETTLAARLAKYNEYFQIQGGSGVGFQRLRGLDGQYLKIEVDKWYSVKIVVNLVYGLQSFYIMDRDTQDILAISENISLTNDIDHINMITFSSSTDMCLDNVNIGTATCEDTFIFGSPYARRATKYQYYFLGLDSDGDVTTIPQGTTKWSLVKAKSGVSIDETSGRLILGSTIEPGVVVIKAERTVNDIKYEAMFSVNVTN